MRGIVETKHLFCIAMAPHILVIDDRISLPRFIAIELDAEGYQVSIHSDGVIDLSIIQAFNPDLVVLNWELRNASGVDICQQLSLSDHPLPIVIITAKDESSCQVAMAMGVIACLTKPFSMSDLLETIDLHLQSKKQKMKCSCR